MCKPEVICDLFLITRYGFKKAVSISDVGDLTDNTVAYFESSFLITIMICRFCLC